MSQKEAYEKKMEAQLEKWSAEIDGLKAKAKMADADARIAINEEIDSAASKKKAAKEKLDELKDAGDDAWEDLKHGIEGAWTSLDAAVRSASSRFR